jgi:hypothetical protein
MADVTYASGSSTTVASRTSFSFTFPNAKVGAVVFVYFQVDNNPAVTAPGSGWTLIRSATSPGNSKGEVYYHRLAAGEAGTTTASWTFANNFCQGAIDAYEGPADTPVDPQDVTSTVNNGATVSPSTVLGLTTVTDRALLLGFFLAPDVTATHTSADFTTERRDTSSVALYELLKTPAGASGNKSIAFSPTTSNDWVTVMVALQPQSSGVPVGTPHWAFPHPPLT